MLQNITITTASKIMLRLLIESALHTKAKALALGLRRTRERLVGFEQRFGMTSAQFERRFAVRELNESLDFIILARNLEWNDPVTSYLIRNQGNHERNILSDLQARVRMSSS